MNRERDRKRVQTILPFLIASCFLLLVSSLLFFRLGSTSLTNFDEAWIASVAADMAERGDFLVGHWNGQIWFYEPPVVTTILAFIISLFGKSEFWLRSLDATSGLLTILLTAFVGWKVTGNKIVGIFSALILVSDIEFLFRSRQINVEVPVAFFLLAALASAIMAMRNGKARWFVSTGLFLGLAFLTKRASPVLAVPAILYALLRGLRHHSVVIPHSMRNLSRIKAGTSDRSLVEPGMTKVMVAILSFLLVVLPWFSYQYWRFGDRFINEFFVGYTLGKIRAVNPGAGVSPFFYLTAIKHAFKFWSFVMPFALGWILLNVRNNREYRVLLVYVATFFVALTTASIKSSWFLLPIHPILAIVVGAFLSNYIVIPRPTRNLSRIESGTSDRFLNRFLIKSGMTGGIFLVSLFQIYLSRHQFIVPDTTNHQVQLVQQAVKLSDSDMPLYLDDEYLPVAVFYSRRRVIPLRFNRGQPIIDLDVPAGSIVLSNQETIGRLKEHVELPLTTLGEERDLLLLRVGLGEEKED